MAGHHVVRTGRCRCDASTIDLDALLSEDERVPSVVTAGAIGLGHLQSGAADKRRKVGKDGRMTGVAQDDGQNRLAPFSNVDLPMWLAKTLVKKNMAHVVFSRSYGDSFRVKLDADPLCVNLRDKSEHYYRIGNDIVTLLANMPRKNAFRKENLDKAAKVVGALRRSLAKRYTQILDRAETFRGHDQTGFVRSLAAMERELFFVAQHSATAFFRWRMRESEKLVASRVIQCGDKRRLQSGAVVAGEGAAKGESGGGSKRARR